MGYEQSVGGSSFTSDTSSGNGWREAATIPDCSSEECPLDLANRSFEQG